MEDLSMPYDFVGNWHDIDEDGIGVTIQLSSLEVIWYGLVEIFFHRVVSKYPVSINVPHMKVMRDRVIDSVFNRTGINIRDFDSIIHATTSPGRDEKGNILDYANEKIIRNVA